MFKFCPNNTNQYNFFFLKKSDWRKMEKEYLTNSGIHVKEDWLELCINFIKKEIKPKDKNGELNLLF
jgi:hypothetical protein